MNITLDSTSNNDRLVSTLPAKIPLFSGVTAQVRCFNHVLDLTGRMIVRQFDVLKPKEADAVLAAAEQALIELAKGTDIEEMEMRIERDVDDNSVGSDEEELDDLEGNDDEGKWSDERDSLTEEELETLNETIWPVRLILVKVSIWLTSWAY